MCGPGALAVNGIEGASEALWPKHNGVNDRLARGGQRKFGSRGEDGVAAGQ